MIVDLLVFQHSKGSPPGSTLDWIKENQLNHSSLTYHIHFWGKNSFDTLSSINYKALLILGGPQNVDEEKQYPWLIQEKHFIKNSLLQNKPIIGLCLGGQLLAEALGAKVSRHIVSEVGWHKVQIFPENFNFDTHANTSKNDNSKDKIYLNENLNTCSQFHHHKDDLHPLRWSQLDVFQYHSYAFELPADSKLIATNSITSCQGFMYHQNVIGLQFHPEATQNWILECCQEIENSPNLGGEFVQSSQMIKAQIDKQTQLQQWYFELIQYWLNFL